MRRPDDNQYLAGNYAPVEDEVTAHDLPSTGRSPPSSKGDGCATVRTPSRSTTLQAPLVPGRRHGPRRAPARRQRRVVQEPLRARRSRLPRACSAPTPTSAASPVPHGRWSRAEPPGRARLRTRLARTQPIQRNPRRALHRAPQVRPRDRRTALDELPLAGSLDHVNYTVVGSDGRVTNEPPSRSPTCR